MKGSTTMYWFFILCMILAPFNMIKESSITKFVIVWGTGIICLGLSFILNVLEKIAEKK